MDTQFLETFLLVVDCGSLAEAARRLGLGPAAVTQRITVLGEVGATWRLLLSEPMVVQCPQALAHADPLTLLRDQPFIRYAASRCARLDAHRHHLQSGQNHGLTDA